MSRTSAAPSDAQEAVPPVEYRPPSHPGVLFRTHPGAGPYSILHLEYGSYWIQGTWLVVADGRMMVVKDRVFQVEELAHVLIGVDLPEPFISGGLAFS